MSGKIWEIFPFFNEAMLAEIRMEESKADCIVVIEASETFSGLSKPFLFPQHLRERVRYIQLNGFQGLKGAWAREEFQENYARNFLDISDDDIVVCSDCDEIPNWAAILELKEKLNDDFPAARLGMTHHKYRFNLVDPYVAWEKAGVCTGGIFKERNFCGIRLWDQAPVIQNGGWHFYGIGSDLDFLSKARATSHFDDKETLDLIRRLESGWSLIDSERAELVRYPIEHLPAAALNFAPEFFQQDEIL